MSFLQANSSAPDNAPSPTPSNMSSSGTKRKRPVVASQPDDPHHGEHVYTRLGYATEYLKKTPTEWKTFEDIMSYLGVAPGNAQRAQLRILMRAENVGNRITWKKVDDMYRYKPKLAISDAESLKRYFQIQQSAQGLKVADLKDGWPNVAEELKGMEKKKEILVKRSKDGQPKCVWNNDPSLVYPMAADFAVRWHGAAIPATADELRKLLIDAGLTAASQAREVNTAPKAKKKKVVRRGGKTTNTHIQHLLKDFSGMKKS